MKFFKKSKRLKSLIVLSSITLFSSYSYALVDSKAENSTDITKKDDSIKNADKNQADFEKYYNQGMNSFYNKNYNYAIVSFKKALELKPLQYEIYNILGSLYDRTGEYKKAIEHYKKSLDFNSKDYRTYHVIAKTYNYGIRDFKKAMEFYKKTIELNPSSIDTYYELGNLYHYDLGDFKNALETYKKITKLVPNESYSYYYIGIVQRKLKNYDLALKAFEKSLDLKPNNDLVYDQIGLIYNYKNELSKSIENHKKAIKLNPRNYEAFTNLGYAYSNSFKYQKALEAYKKSLELRGDYFIAMLNIFETNLVLNKPFDKELEARYIKLFKNSEILFVQYKMLKTLENIKNSQNEDEFLTLWSTRYKKLNLNWNFESINKWIDESDFKSETKENLKKAVKVFENR